MHKFKNHLSSATRVTILVFILACSVYSQAAPAASVVGVAPDGANAMEFIGRSDQEGSIVTHYGYLTHISGLADDSLFSDTNIRTEATARFTFFATTQLNARHELGNIIVTAAPGTLTIYFNETPGSDFNDPASFASGEIIATFAARFHNVLNVQAPNAGLSTGTADLVQLRAKPFMLNERRLRLGLPGLRERITAFGQGTRNQIDPLKSFFLLGGNFVVTKTSVRLLP